jgi:hypothetical protein
VNPSLLRPQSVLCFWREECCPRQSARARGAANMATRAGRQARGGDTTHHASASCERGVWMGMGVWVSVCVCACLCSALRCAALLCSALRLRPARAGCLLLWGPGPNQPNERGRSQNGLALAVAARSPWPLAKQRGRGTVPGEGPWNGRAFGTLVGPASPLVPARLALAMAGGLAADEVSPV